MTQTSLFNRLVKQACFVLGKTKILSVFTHQEFLLFRFNFGKKPPQNACQIPVISILNQRM
jgi:hypothetical protein